MYNPLSRKRITSIEAGLEHPFCKGSHSKGIKKRALHVQASKKTKHFIEKLLTQPYRLLHTFSILVKRMQIGYTQRQLFSHTYGYFCGGPKVGGFESEVVPWSGDSKLERACAVIVSFEKAKLGILHRILPFEGVEYFYKEQTFWLATAASSWT